MNRITEVCESVEFFFDEEVRFSVFLDQDGHLRIQASGTRRHRLAIHPRAENSVSISIEK